MRKTLCVSLLAAVCAASGARAAASKTDENGIVPAYWLEFEGSLANSGSGADISFESAGNSYYASRGGLAFSGSMPYTATGPGYGGGAFTIVESARVSATAGHIVWAMGQKSDSRGLALASAGADKIKLCRWTSSETTTLIEADVADMSTKFHSYAVTVDPSAPSVALYVDGSLAGSSTDITGAPYDNRLQFGGIYGGEPDGNLVKASDSFHDDWRIYHQALTAAQIQTIAAAFAPWPDAEIASNTTIDDASDPWTGSGETLLRSHIELAYDLTQDTTNNKLENFQGTIILDKGAELCSYQNGVRSGYFCESYTPFGDHARIVFAGGTMVGFYNRNNVTLPNDIVVRSGTESRFNSWKAASGDGCNTTLAGNLSGGGKLTIRDELRWVRLEGDNSGFSGELSIYLKGNNSALKFENASSGFENGLLTYNEETKVHDIELNHAAGTTLKIGDLNLTAGSIKIANASTLEIGNRGGTSEIDIPVTGKPLALDKVGAGTLTFGTNMTVLEGSTATVSGGTLVVEGAMPNLTVTVAPGGAIEGNSTDGAIAANVVFASGSSIAIPVAEGQSVDNRTTYSILTVASGCTATGSPAVSNATGRWKTYWVANQDGSSTLAAKNIDGLMLIVR